MFDRLFESGGAHHSPPIGAWAVSAVANATLAYAAATATRAPEPVHTPAGEMREVVYLLPLPPQRVPFEAVGLQWNGGGGPGFLNAPIDPASLLAAAGGGEGAGVAGERRGGRRKRASAAESVPLDGAFDGGEVYIAAETDRPVAYDPSSTGPVYPPLLQQAGIEGSATIRFVVDSTGLADMTTVQELVVTHPEFAAAVREALPGMHFRPAELGDRRVRQLVEQEFKFKIQLSVSAAAPAAPPDSLQP